jgi:hypothetical protein
MITPLAIFDLRMVAHHMEKEGSMALLLKITFRL